MAKKTQTFYCTNESCVVRKSGKGLRATGEENAQWPNCPKCGCRMTIYQPIPTWRR